MVLRFLFFPVLVVTLWPSLIQRDRSIIEQIGLRYQAIIDFCGLGDLKMQANTLNEDYEPPSPDHKYLATAGGEGAR